MKTQLNTAGLRTVIAVYSPDDAVQQGISSWSLWPLQKEEDSFRQYALRRGIRNAFEEVGTENAYAPNVTTASARIVTGGELTIRILLGRGMSLYRNIQLHADGVFLKPGETFVMSGAGCPIITAEAGPYMIVAHAARDSLVERGAVMGTPRRRHISVAHAIVDAFKKRGIRTEHMVMHMQFAIPMMSFLHRFDHPDYGDYNRRLGSFIDSRWPDCTRNTPAGVFISLEDLFIEQALQLGVRNVAATNSLEDFPDLAYTRDGKDPSRRNLYVVKRNA